jgi:xanthine dehydrogenase large subunit
MSQHHESAIGHVTGSAIYTDEIPSFANAVHLYPVLANVAAGKLISIDTTAALQITGVHAVLTAKDIPGRNNTGPIVQDEVLLPDCEISYHNQAIAWVVADTFDVARRAAALVRFLIEPITPVLSIARALAANRFHSNPQVVQRGNVETALQAAPHRLSGHVHNGEQDHFYLETHASTAVFDAMGVLQVYSSTQHPTETQHIVAAVMAMPMRDVVVSCLRMGGGFGGKESQANAFAALVAIAAKRTGRPAKIKLPREIDMRLTGKRHAFETRYEVGFDQTGVIQALRADVIADAGWSLDLSPPVLMRAMVHIDNAYFLPHAHITGRLAKTNKTSATAFRGFGGPQGMLIAEDVIERIVHALQLPAPLVRARNFYREGRDHTHYGQPVGELRMARLWQELLASSQFAVRQTEIDTYNQTQPHRKRGIAITPVKFGISFNKVTYNQAGALVLVYTDGSVQINHGGTEMGQGLHSKMLVVAAKTLGIAVSDIRLMTTATDKVPNTSATAASSGADLNGQAIKQACETIVQRLFDVVRQRLALPSECVLTIANGQIYADQQAADQQAADQQAIASFPQAVSWAYEARVSLSATGFYATPNLSWNMQENRGTPFFYFSYGAAVSEVEVDAYTGEWKLLRTDLLHDVGDSLNTSIDIGQIEGGFVQGMGWLTMEELVWDDQGKLRTAAPSTYKIPTICEVPIEFHTQLLTRAAQPGVIFGSKAVGEPPLMLAISVRSALKAAVAAFGDGSRYPELRCPSTPEAILQCIESMTTKHVNAPPA